MEGADILIPFDEQGKLTLELEPQSPLIHFQAREAGATLRASEVKPKLDQFLISKLKKQRAPGEAPSVDPKLLLPAVSGKNVTALNYRMQIFCQEPPAVVVINNDRSLTKDNPGYRGLPNYPVFYANSGIKEAQEQRLGVVSSPTVVIRCFIPELRALISAHVEEFFLVTNFGTMQNKGFGGFLPKNCDPKPAQMRAFLAEKTGTDLCFRMQIPGSARRDPTDFSACFKWIERFYRLMKSGVNINGEYERSFLFRYMHGIGIGNEKAWMKKKGISPNVSTRKKTPPPSDHPERYVRAFFGAAGSITYQREDRGRMTVTISSDELKRIPSPVFFKIIRNTVYITAGPVPVEVYGVPFTFKGFRREKLPTPERAKFEGGAFDMESFLRQYADHYNDLVRSRKLPRYLQGAPEVTEVKET